MQVKLYALSTCPYCRMTRKFMDESDIEYELLEVDLLEGDERDTAVAEVREVSGGASFPVVTVDEEVIVGFNKKRLRELLLK